MTDTVMSTDLPVNDPTNPAHRLADDLRNGRIPGYAADDVRAVLTMLAASPQDEEGPKEPLEPVVYGDERDELLALIRKRCPDFTAFPECPPEEMVKGGGTERKNDEAIERAFQDFRLAASPQGEGDCVCVQRGDGPEGCGLCNETGVATPPAEPQRITHDGGPNPAPARELWEKVAQIIEAAIERHNPGNSLRHTVDDADAILALIQSERGGA